MTVNLEGALADNIISISKPTSSEAKAIKAAKYKVWAASDKAKASKKARSATPEAKEKSRIYASQRYATEEGGNYQRNYSKRPDIRAARLSKQALPESKLIRSEKRKSVAGKAIVAAYYSDPDQRSLKRARCNARASCPIQKIIKHEYDIKRVVTPEIKAARSAYSKTDARKAAVKVRYAIPSNRLSSLMSKGIRRYLKLGKQGRSWKNLVSYDVSTLRTHIERQFTNGMNWQNMGKWHIDHIQPLSSFNFDTSDCPDFHHAWALSNLRPLWAHENLSKHAKRMVLL